MKTEQEIFSEAAELPAGKRASFLDEACGEDSVLRKSLEQLLDVIPDEDDEFLEKSAFARADEKPAPGRLGDYILENEIARGAMGVVYRAKQESLGRTVALKMIRSSILATDTDITRFQSEAQMAARLDHPNIVPIYEVGEIDGQHFFSMRLIEGGTLREQIQDFSANPKQAVKLIVKIARAVQVAHQQGVLHRDLKPGNILIDEAGEPFITDFGIARNLDSESDLTMTGQIIGTLSYMAPEQAKSGSALTTAVDVYGLGAILYQLLTGQPPNKGETSLETLQAISELEPKRLGTLVKTLDRDLETIVMKCLERDPAARYLTAASVANELQRWLDGEPIKARPVRGHERLVKWIRRNPVHAAFGITAMFFLLTLAIGGPLIGLNQTRLKERAEEQLYFAEMNLASQALLERSSYSSIRQRIDAVRPIAGAKAPWEWRFFDGLTRETPFRFRNGFMKGPSTVCDWNPDGLMLAVSGRSPVVRIFNETGEIIHKIRVPNGEKDISFNNDGSFLAVTVKNQLLIFETTNWTRATQIPISTGNKSSLAWHPERRNQIAVGGEAGIIQIWQIDSNPQTKLFDSTGTDRLYNIGDICWSPDGSEIAFAGQNGHVFVIDPMTGKLNRKPTRQRTMVNALAWARTSIGEQFSADGVDHRRMNWNTQGWIFLSTSEGHTAAVNDLEFSPDGDYIASCSNDTTVNVYQSIRRKEITVSFAHEAPVTSVSWHPNGLKIASTGSDGWVVIHDLSSNQKKAIWSIPIEEEAAEFCIHPDGSEVAVAQQEKILIVGLGAMPHRFLAPDLAGDKIKETAWSPDGDSFLVSTKNGVFLVDSKTAEVKRSFPELKNATGLSWSPGGSRFALRPAPERLQIIPLNREKSVGFDWESAERIKQAQWSPNGKFIAVSRGAGAAVLVLDSLTGKEVHRFGRDKNFRSVVWTPDGTQLACCTKRDVTIFDLTTGEAVRTFSGMGNSIQGLHWNVDGSRLLIEMNRPFPPQIWNPVKGRKLMDLPLLNSQIRDIKWSPDGNRILILERWHLRVLTAAEE